METNHFKEPLAKLREEITYHFSEKKIDHYSWLRDRKYPEINDENILNYLKLENDYANKILSQYSFLIQNLYEEMKKQIINNDRTVAIKIGDYYYYSYIKKDMDYWVHCRSYQSLEGGEEEVIIDENQLSKSEKYFSVGSVKISPSHDLVAYTVDYSGDEEFFIKVKNIKHNKYITNQIPPIFPIIEWNIDSSGFFYIPTGDNWKPSIVMFHKLGTDCKNDIIIYEEKDITFSVRISKTSNQKYLIITSESKEENENYYIDLSQSNIDIKLFYKRSKNHIYYIDNHQDKFIILTNDQGENFRLAIVNKNDLSMPWGDLVKYDKGKYIKDFQLYYNHIVFLYSDNNTGLKNISIMDLSFYKTTSLKFHGQSYDVGILRTTYDADSLRYYYTSLAVPKIIKEYNFKLLRQKVLKTTKLGSAYNSKNYEVERLYATTRDNKKVPISLIYKKSLFKLGSNNPLYLYGYGSYGISIPQSFRSSILPIIDRGFIYAIAHIRGGDDLGYEWYDSSKFLNKKRTFYDFIDSAKYLIAKKYVKSGNITISGGSAGGMLVGFCSNEEPHLFKNVVAHVPFVDVLNTMLDESLPLTPGEFKEWGNPKEKKYYDYIKEYSPYENVKKQEYPNFFVTAGLKDPRVTYWEPAKWVAKLRANKTNQSKIIFKTNMKAGHRGKTGRYNYLEEIAEEYAFIISRYNECK